MFLTFSMEIEQINFFLLTWLYKGQQDLVIFMFWMFPMVRKTIWVGGKVVITIWVSKNWEISFWFA